MDDNERASPSLPTNYITIVDLQKRWLEQQQKKQLNEEIKKKEEELKYHSNLNKKSTTNSRNSIRNSQLQISNQFKSYGNPNFEKGKSFHNKFDHKNIPEIVVNTSKVPIVSGDKEIKDDNKTMKTKKNTKYNRREKGDYDQTVEKDDQEKVKVNEDDQTVQIEPKFKRVSVNGTKWISQRSTAAIKGKNTVYLGYRRVDHREKNPLVEQEKEKKTPEVCVVERQNQVNVNWKSRGAVREANKLHGEVMLEKYNNGEKKGCVIVDDQMAEIESKFKDAMVSGNNRRWRAGFKGPYPGYRRVDYRGFNLKNKQVEQNSLNKQVEQNSLKQSSEGSKVHGGFEKVEENTVKSSEEHGKLGLENWSGRKVHGLPTGKSVRIGLEGDSSVTTSYERRRELRYGKSMAAVGPRRANRHYGEFVWVKRSELNDK